MDMDEDEKDVRDAIKNNTTTESTPDTIDEDLSEVARLRYWVTPLHKKIEKAKEPLRRFAQCVASLCGLGVNDVIDEITQEEFESTHIKSHKKLVDVVNGLLKDITLAKTTEEVLIKRGILRGLLKTVNKHISRRAKNIQGQYKIGPPSTKVTATGKSRLMQRGTDRLPPAIRKIKRLPYSPQVKSTTNRPKKDDPSVFTLMPEYNENTEFMNGLEKDVTEVVQWLNNMEGHHGIKPTSSDSTLDSPKILASVISLNSTFSGFALIAASDINTKYRRQFTLESLCYSEGVYVGFAKLVALLYQRSMTNRAHVNISKSGPGYSFQKDTTFTNGKTRFQLIKEEQDMTSALNFFANVKEIVRVVYESKMRLGGVQDEGNIKQRLLVKTWEE